MLKEPSNPYGYGFLFAFDSTHYNIGRAQLAIRGMGSQRDIKTRLTKVLGFLQ